MHCANLEVQNINLHQQQRCTQQKHQLLQTDAKEEEESNILKMVLDAGILILEGRLPDRTSKRGYVEGPHCVLCPRAQNHRCDINNYLCKKAGKYQKLLKSIWKEFKGLCIELRMCADCNCGEKKMWTNAMNNRLDYVLEQWYFEITNVKNEKGDIGVMNPYGLIQAIRSQIHFSQLSAWWSSNQAQLPKNITFHILPLKQADVNSCPLQHKFPVLSFSTCYLQVILRSQPRCDVLPKVHCPVHCDINDLLVDDRMRIHCDRLGKHHCQAVEDVDENDNEPFLLDKCDSYEKINNIIREIEINKIDTISVANNDRHNKVGRNVIKNVKIDTEKVCGSSKCKKGTISELKQKQIIYRNCVKSDANADSKMPSQSTFHRTVKDFNVQCPFGFSNIKNNLEYDKDVERKISHLSKPKTFSVIYDSNYRHNINEKSRNSKNNNKNNENVKDNSKNKNYDNTKYNSAISFCESTKEITVHSFNIRNWTNMMMINVMSKICGSKPSFFNELPYDATSIDFLMNKTDNSNVYNHNGNNLSKFENHFQIDDSKNIVKNEDKNNFRNYDNEAYRGRSLNAHLKLHSEEITNVVNNKEIQDKKSTNELLMFNSSSLWNSNKLSIQKKNLDDLKWRFSYKTKKRTLPIVANIVETILSGHVCFTYTLPNFGVSIIYGSTVCPQNSIELAASAYFYHFGDGIVSKSYLIKSRTAEKDRGIQIPVSGSLNVQCINSEKTSVKLFSISYDLSDMPRCSKTFLRHSSYYLPRKIEELDTKWLQAFLQIKLKCSKSGKIYIINSINAIIFQKSDLNTATQFETRNCVEDRSVTEFAYRKNILGEPFNTETTEDSSNE